MTKAGWINELEIIFFDAGNVLVCDDPATLFCYRKFYERMGGRAWRKLDEFFKGREEHLQAGGDLWQYVKNCVDGNEFPQFQAAVRREMYGQWDAVSPPIPGMDEAIRELARTYRLGILANQPPEIVDVLKARDLACCFEVWAVSGIVGLSKPDPALYRRALEMAGVEPHKALMVGDRIDNDIAPAKSVGMRTMWLTLGTERRGWKPADEFEQAYLESLCRACFSDRVPEAEHEQPDLIARSPEDLLKQLIPPRKLAMRPTAPQQPA